MRAPFSLTSKSVRRGWAVAIAGVFLYTAPAIPSNVRVISGNTLDVAASRTVLRAILALERNYGYVITYEEPKYVYAGDLKDITGLRRDLNRYPQGKAPKVLIPLGGRLQLPLPRSSRLSDSEMYDLLKQLVDEWNDSNQGGAHFAVQENDAIFHIVPTEVRDISGNWQPVQSALAVSISLPKEPRTERQTFEAICGAVSAKAGIRLYSLPNGGLILGPPRITEYALGANDEQASNVLLRAFKAMGITRSWYLLYDPTTHAYYMNINAVPGVAAAAPSAAKPAPRPAQAPSPPVRGCGTTCIPHHPAA